MHNLVSFYLFQSFHFFLIISSHYRKKIIQNYREFVQSDLAPAGSIALAKSLNNNNDPVLSKVKVSQVSLSIVNWFVKSQFTDKTIHVGFSGGENQQHMKEGHERIRHSLKNKDGTCVSYKDLILKYGAEIHYVYCSRINYNGLRVEHCIQNALEPHMEMASIEA